MNEHYRNLITTEFRNCVTNTIQRISDNGRTYRPFHAALLSEDVLFWSAFERSFSTSFGQRVIEEIAKLVALSNGAEDASRQKETLITIDVAYDNAIHEHIQTLRERRLATFSWESAYSAIRQVQPSGSTKEIRIISDLW